LSAEDKQAMRFMLNFDMVAVGTEWLLIGTPTMQEQGRQIMESMGLASRFIVPLGFSSDYASFMNAGIPSLFLHRSNDPLLHTPDDVSGRISLDQLGESMRIGLAFLEGINPA
jgi:Zn-dependent M28 family amino/carboxypeptidase